MMNNTERRDEIIERLCALGNDIITEYFNHDRRADCLCIPDRDLQYGFEWDESVIQFIETVVREKLNLGRFER